MPDRLALGVDAYELERLRLGDRLRERRSDLDVPRDRGEPSPHEVVVALEEAGDVLAAGADRPARRVVGPPVVRPDLQHGLVVALRLAVDHPEELFRLRVLPGPSGGHRDLRLEHLPARGELPAAELRLRG